MLQAFLIGLALRRTGYAADNGIFYLLQDHLHSSSATVAQNGTLAGSRNYFYPFGGNRGGSAFNDLTTKRFTGQYHEATIPGGEGLSYYGARWYDAQLGRFTTPDSIIPKPDNPQDFNRYAYVTNNPLKYEDPSGHCRIGTTSKGNRYISKWNCTVHDFTKLSWGERREWVRLFMQTTGVAWFKNILGILGYFETDADFSASGWASLSDAAVLQAINNGWLRYKNGDDYPQPVSESPEGAKASAAWKEFFDSVVDNPGGARQKWGVAEQAGVDYGTALAAPFIGLDNERVQQKANVFVELGNVYRGMIAGESYERFPLKQLEGVGFTPLDPRSSQSALFTFGAAKVVVDLSVDRGLQPLRLPGGCPAGLPSGFCAP